MNLHEMIEPLVIAAAGPRPDHPDFINLMSTYDDFVRQAVTDLPMQDVVWNKTGIPAEMIRLYSLNMAEQCKETYAETDEMLVLVAQFCMAVGSGRHMHRGKDMRHLVGETIHEPEGVVRLTFAGIDEHSVKWIATLSALKGMVNDPTASMVNKITSQWITGLICGWNYDSLKEVTDVFGE